MKANLTIEYNKFMSAARAVSRIMPIIVLKAGRSPAGAQAAASHSGVMAGADDVYQAAFKIRHLDMGRKSSIRETFIKHRVVIMRLSSWSLTRQ